MARAFQFSWVKLATRLPVRGIRIEFRLGRGGEVLLSEPSALATNTARRNRMMNQAGNSMRFQGTTRTDPDGRSAMVKGNRSFRLALPHNDSLPGMRSVIDAIESRGGVFSSFRDSANKISASVFTTRVGAAENHNGTTGLNRQATTPKAATQRYSRWEAGWNMTTVAAAGIRISKPTWYPTA